MALYLGPLGFGILYQFLNFQAILVSVTNLGSPVGLTSYISQKKNDSDLVKMALKSLTLLIFTFTMIATFLMVIFSTFICNSILGINGYEKIFIILISSTPFLVLFTIVESYLKGFQKLNTLLKINIVSSIINIIIIFPLLYFYNLEGISIYFLIISLIPVTYYILIDRYYLKSVFESFKKINLQPIKNILKIGVVSLFSSILFHISILQIRKFIILNFDLTNAGIYQSILGLSTNYFMIIFTFISYYTLPKVSTLKNSLDISGELNQQLRFLMFIIVPMILIVLTYRIFLIRMFYSNEFIEASNLFYFQVLGDLVKSMGALFGIWLIPRMKIKVLLTVDTIFNLILILLPYLLIIYIPHNLIIIPITYFLAFFIHFMLIFLYTKRSLNFKFSTKSVRTLVISFISIFLTFVINFYYPIFSYYAVIFIIVTNTYLILEKDEINKLKSFLINFKSR